MDSVRLLTRVHSPPREVDSEKRSPMLMPKRRLRRELRAMHRHVAMLRGLVLLTELRLSEHDAVKKELGLTTVESKEPLNALRTLLRTKFMPGDTKARMLFDEFQEIDLYITGPLELFFALAQAMVERYRKLTAEDPTLCHPDLDRYLNANAPAFEAVKNLRDWLIHPGISRRTDEAVSMFWDEDGDPVADHPYTISARLLQLFGEVAEKINGFARRQ